ncbi:MAG TPA: MAPEG family protein [Solimonas sp.]
MTIALWCILVAALLHMPFAAAAKWSSRFDNARPRDYLQQLSGWRQRANWTQQNSLEAFPFFAAAVLVAHVVAGPNAAADQLAIGFIALRIAFGLCYLADKATLRSLVWVGAVACTIGLFVVAARAA